jgi:hypothetical protein
MPDGRQCDYSGPSEEGAQSEEGYVYDLYEFVDTLQPS